MSETLETLAEIARLGRYAESRRHDFTRSEPCDWAPYTIECPDTGLPFTDKGAWGLICHLLEGYPESFQKVVLEKPPGQVAYQTEHTLRNGIRVYIKVQLSHGKAEPGASMSPTWSRGMSQDTVGMSSTGEVCLECGSSRLAESVKEQSFPYSSQGERVALVARIPVFTCLECGYEFFDERGETARHAAVCEHLGVQPPEEIRRIREAIGLSRAELCELAGFGPASLQRWETGAVIPNASSDRLVYLLQFPENLKRLKTKQIACHGQSVAPAVTQASIEEDSAGSAEMRPVHARHARATRHLRFPTLEMKGDLGKYSRVAESIQKRQSLFASTW